MVMQTPEEFKQSVAKFRQVRLWPLDISFHPKLVYFMNSILAPLLI